MKRSKFLALVVGAAATFALTTACESPDSQSRFDEYSEIVGETEPTSELCDSEKRDIEGKYFMRLQHSIGPQNHIMMEVDVTPQGDNYKLVFQPLKADYTQEMINVLDEDGNIVYKLDEDGNPRLDKDGNPIPEKINAPRDDARAPAGDPIILENVEVSSNGEMHFEMERVVVDGEANTFTWGEIEADITLTVAVCSTGVICGKGSLQTYRPLQLTGVANFGALEVDTVDLESTAPVDCDSDPI